MNQLNIFANRVIYFWNKLPNQIKNSNNVKKIMIKLDDFRKNVKIILKDIFGKYKMNYSIEFDWYIDFILIVYMFCVDSFFLFFKVDVRRL